MTENGENASPAGEQAQSPFNGLFRMMLIFFAISSLSTLMKRTSSPPQDSLETFEGENKEEARKMHIKPTLAPKNNMHSCLWPRGTRMDMNIYVTDTFEYSKRDILGEWFAKDLTLDASESNARNVSLTIVPTERIYRNETHVYAHIYVRRKVNRKTTDEDVLYKRVLLTKHRIRKKKKEVKNLLGQDKEDEGEEEKVSSEGRTSLDIASFQKDVDSTLLYFKPTLTLQLVDALGPFQKGSFPPQVMELFDFPLKNIPTTEGMDLKERSKLISESGSDFYPIFYPSEFWIKTDDLIAVNETLQNVTIDFSLTAVSFWKWQLMATLENQWKSQEGTNGINDSADSDIFRTILHDTNPYLLAITFVVSILHTIFDFLAFKNDISFHSKRKSMEGASLRRFVVIIK